MTSAAANTTQKQRGRPFAKGQSGNPRGKRPGTRHRLTQLAERLMEGEAEAVVRKVVEAAKGGDVAAARLILDRVLPARKGSPVRFALPSVSTAAEVVGAIGAVLAAVSDGVLTPDEGTQIAGLLETKRKAIESVDLEARLTALERKIAQ
jgi:Family of unknown function (DUF5681)